MSFDSEFDYTGCISFIDNHTDSINAEISSITTRLSNLGNVNSAFDYLTGPEITSLNHTKNVYNGMVQNFQNLKGNIVSVTSLSSGDKSALYTFYTDALSLTNETKQTWMARMVSNTDGLIAEAANVNAESLSSTEKQLLAEIICQKYPINNAVQRVKTKF